MSFTFTTQATTTTTAPPDRRAELNVGNTQFAAIEGTGADNTAPDSNPSTYLNITLMSEKIFKVVTDSTRYPYLNRDRIEIIRNQIVFDATAQKTTFVVRFKELAAVIPAGPTTNDPFATTASTTTATPQPPAPPGETTTTAPAPRPQSDVPSSYEIAWLFRRHIFQQTANSFSPPYTLVAPAFFYDIPEDTPAPPTQELYTPVPTVNIAESNVTNFLADNAANAEIIAIVVSVVLGSIFVVGGILAFKGWYDNKKLHEKPSGLKWHRGGRDAAYAA